jgi:hypothetical protein
MKTKPISENGGVETIMSPQHVTISSYTESDRKLPQFPAYSYQLRT